VRFQPVDATHAFNLAAVVRARQPEAQENKKMDLMKRLPLLMVKQANI
jgi:hypothetical protein